jgi:adenylyl-sulfate kinase
MGAAVSEPTASSFHLPDLRLEPTALADAELALLSVLPDGHILADAVALPGDSQARHRDRRPVVRLRLSRDMATTVLDAGGAVLRDEELTPLAELSEVSVEQLDDGMSAFVSGVLSRRRSRESGEGAQYALSQADMDPATRRRWVLVLARPLVDADADAVAALRRFPGEVVVVVPAGQPDSQHDGIPTWVLLHAARELTTDGHLAGRVVLRTAPLAWRDPDSNTALVRLLATALHADLILHLRADDDRPQDRGGEQWRRVRDELDRGADEPLTGVSAPTESVLRRWKPPKAHRGVVVMFTGLSGSGKSTLARAVSAQVLQQTARTLTLLDGDVVRTMLSSGLGFDRASRVLNVRRIGYVGAEIARHGGIAVCAPIAPYASTRADVRRMVEQVGDFVLIHVSTPLEVCERRDLKGLYAKARAGLIPEFTGISDPYDVPLDADVSVDTSTMSPEAAVAVVYDHLVSGGWLTKDAP